MKALNYTMLVVVLFAFNLFADDHLNEGKKLLQQGKFRQAEVFFKQQVKERENNAAANYYLGRAYLMLGNYDEAADYCETAVELADSVAEYHFWLANALGQKAQNSNILKQAWLAPKILKQFERTVQLDPKHVGGHVGCANFYIMAPSIMGGDLEKARKEADILIKLAPMKGRLLKISIYEKEGKSELAEREYDAMGKSLADSTRNYSFYNQYGYFLLKRKKYDKAIKMFRKQVQLAPDKANPHDSFGDGLRAAGRLQEALAEYQKALQMDPTFKASKKKIKQIKEELH